MNTNTTGETPDGDDVSPDNVLVPGRRQRKILDYVEEADRKPSALEANIALLNADLMAYIDYFRQDLDQVRSDITNPKERLQWMYPVTEQVYKLARQVDSFTRTNMRLERERQKPVPPDEWTPPRMGHDSFSSAESAIQPTIRAEVDQSASAEMSRAK